MITCHYCQATTHQYKAGRTRLGAQRYRCRHCDRTYIPGARLRAGRHSLPKPVVEINAGGNIPQPAGSPALVVSRTKALEATESVEALPNAQLSSTKNKAMQRLEPTYADLKIGDASPVSVAFSVAEKTHILPKATESATTSNRWGWVPEIALLESFGLLILAWGFVEARAVVSSAQLLFWIGLAVMVLPVVIRLASAEPSRRERIALVLLLGMSLYLVKVMHSPVAFTFPDELSHLRNVGEILETHRLFQENPIQPTTAFYPGLPTVTSTLSSLSGLSVFSAGLLVIGAARLILFLALYLLFEQVSGSARAAGLATVFYMANPNFLYWTAEYAYEPLALPLLIFVLLMVAKKEMANDGTRSGAWTVAALLVLLTVVITHHMSSYIVTGLLGAITVLFIIFSRGKRWGPWQLTLAGLFAASFWLIFVANLTIKYLSPVLGGAIEAFVKMIMEEETSRQLFMSSKGPTEASTSSTPLWEQLVAMGSVVVIALGLPLGALEIWKWHRSKVFALLLGAIALSYLPVQTLRFTKAGWETANRSSEFLFIGIGFVLALGIIRFWLSHWSGWASKMILGGLTVALFFGGLIAGWPPRARLSRPYVIDTGGYLVRPQNVTVSEWMLEYLGPDNRIAASRANAKVFGAHGQHPFTDKGPIKNMFLSDSFGRSERKSLLRRDIQYVVSDRQNVSWDHMIGYYFYNRFTTRSSDLILIEPQIFGKLEGVKGITRMLDSGDIVIYDVEAYLAAYRETEKVAKLEPSVIAMPESQPNTITILGPPADPSEDLTKSSNAPLISSPSEMTAGVSQASLVTTSALRTMAALLLVLFLPGFALTVILFKRERLKMPERLLLGVGLSVALTALIGLLLNWTPWGLQVTSLWAALLLGLTVEVAVIVFVRRPRWTEMVSRPSNLNFTGRQWALMNLAALVTIIAIQVARTPSSQHGFEGYTMLWIQPGNVPDTLRLGVSSEEFAMTKYQIRFELNGTVREGPILELSPGGAWESVVRLPIDQLVGNPLTVFLYRLDHPTEVYRHAVWWPEPAIE
jgi:hypothetical protein